MGIWFHQEWCRCRFPRDGIDYDDLSEEDKEAWDLIEWDEEGSVPNKVDASAINDWLFNKDTVDKVLEHLMRQGLRVEDGQKIGKTIIFAKNHNHAIFVQERFDANYPHLKGKFARVIDNQETYAQDLIDKFSLQKNQPKDAPQIAISVDMLDTGVDVPDVVNLVFFKRVRSKTKFWQMIGRGTRLKECLFGDGLDKEFFYVFDFCGNFEFFNANPEGTEGGVQEAVGTRIFQTRLELLQSLRALLNSEFEAATAMVAEVGETKMSNLEEGIESQLWTEVSAMNLDNFIVRPKRKIVEGFYKKERWGKLGGEDFAELFNEVSKLPNQLPPEHPDARYFDLLMLRIQLGTLQGDPAITALIKKVKELASQLMEFARRIPEVKNQAVLIEEIQSDEYWEGVTLPMLEVVRRNLRDLIKHIDRPQGNIVTTNFEDQIGEGSEVTLPNLSAAVDRGQYKKKFEGFLKNHEDHLTLKKVKYNEPLTKLDLEELERMLFESGEVGSREEFDACFGEQESLGLFIRKLVGLDREAAKKAFGHYLDTTTFDSRQIQFINQVVDYLTQNGVLDPRMLFQHPFTNLSPDGPVSLFAEEDASKIVAIIREIGSNASIG